MSTPSMIGKLGLLLVGLLIATSSRGSAILRADPDGTNLEQILADDVAEASGSLALDQEVMPRMYWNAGEISESIRSATVQGDDVLDLRGPYDPQVSLGGPAVDAQGGKVYYTSNGDDCDPDCGSIARFPLDGSTGETLLSGPFPKNPAVDPIVAKMCWGDGFDVYDIRCANLDGTGLQILFSDTLALGLAIDGNAGKLYWADYFDGAIRRANLDGTMVETLVTEQPEVYGLAIDPAGDRMWWTIPETGEIRRAGLDGSEVVTILSDQFGARGIAYRQPAEGQADGKIYWVGMGSGGSSDVPASSGWGLIGLAAAFLAALTIAALRAG